MRCLGLALGAAWLASQVVARDNDHTLVARAGSGTIVPAPISDASQQNSVTSQQDLVTSQLRGELPFTLYITGYYGTPQLLGVGHSLKDIFAADIRYGTDVAGSKDKVGHIISVGPFSVAAGKPDSFDCHSAQQADVRDTRTQSNWIQTAQWQVLKPVANKLRRPIYVPTLKWHHLENPKVTLEMAREKALSLLVEKRYANARLQILDDRVRIVSVSRGSLPVLHPLNKFVYQFFATTGAGKDRTRQLVYVGGSSGVWIVDYDMHFPMDGGDQAMSGDNGSWRKAQAPPSKSWTSKLRDAFKRPAPPKSSRQPKEPDTPGRRPPVGLEESQQSGGQDSLGSQGLRRVDSAPNPWAADQDEPLPAGNHYGEFPHTDPAIPSRNMPVQGLPADTLAQGRTDPLSRLNSIAPPKPQTPIDEEGSQGSSPPDTNGNQKPTDPNALPSIPEDQVSLPKNGPWTTNAQLRQANNQAWAESGYQKQEAQGHNRISNERIASSVAAAMNPAANSGPRDLTQTRKGRNRQRLKPGGPRGIPDPGDDEALPAARNPMVDHNPNSDVASPQQQDSPQYAGNTGYSSGSTRQSPDAAGTNPGPPNAGNVYQNPPQIAGNTGYSSGNPGVAQPAPIQYGIRPGRIPWD